MIKIDINRKCINCKFLDISDSREPTSDYSCTINHDSYGFWKAVNPKKDFCGWFKPKKVKK